MLLWSEAFDLGKRKLHVDQIMTEIGKEYIMPLIEKISGQACRGGGKLIIFLGVNLQRW